MAEAIRKVAVLGAGVMGSGIAAHLASVGIPVIMLDIVPRELTPDEQAKGLTLASPAVRNRFALGGVQAALKAKPAAFSSPKFARLITAGNLEDDLHRVAEVDWIVEVVKEDLAVKRALFEKVRAHRREGTPITSNTSGIPIAAMVEGAPEEFRKCFFVTHFFNPVRYMKLLELVTGVDTDPGVVARFARFGERVLGKGIVYGKDTPNFVGNRIGIFGMLATIETMLADGYAVDEVDAIVGPPMGRPKSAAFRTADLVGLDTFVHVANNVYEALPTDEERATFKPPAFVEKMIAKGWLGDKKGQGFYKKEKSAAGKTILVLDPATLEYRPSQKIDIPSIKKSKGIEDVGKRLKMIVNADDRAGKFAWKVLSRSLVYSANRLPEIADDVVNIDRAMRWGFAWDQGPFEAWDAIGVAESVARMEADGLTVPAFAKLAAEKGGFYKSEAGERFFLTLAGEWAPVPKAPEAIVLADRKAKVGVVKKNGGASFIDLGEGVACLEFHTKMNAIDGDIGNMMAFAIEEAERNWKGVVIGNDGGNFSAGANLMLLVMLAQQKKWDDIRTMVTGFQKACLQLARCNVPVVSAPFGLTLGGGAEVTMAADRVQAAAETYMGLVEVGAGLIPGGGGTRMMLQRMLEGIPDGTEVGSFPFVRKAFEIIGMAKVATSAAEAKDIGYLRAGDGITQNREHLLFDARTAVLRMADNYRPALPFQYKLPGESAFAALKLGLFQWVQSGVISAHDALIGEKLAYVLTGGAATPTQPVSDEYLLELEAEAFLSLCGEEKSQARMQALLTTGKPLRN
ncbi:MAG: 3-hydroxyacyl-CoA dehydrogenase [Myxococcales bacterium]